MEADWSATPAYWELRKAMKAGDIAAQNAILNQQVEQTTGAEKAFWLIQRVGIRSRHIQPALDPTWTELDEALALAPDDREIQQLVLLQALSFAVSTERLARLCAILRRLKPYLRELLPSHPFIQANLALIQMKRGRFHDAFVRFTHTFRLIEALGEEWKERRRGALPPLYAEQARVAFRLGFTMEGAAWLAHATASMGRQPNFGIGHFFLALAQAEQAFQEGQHHAARRILQHASAQAAKGESRVILPIVLVEAELLAARIAGAEGNRQAVAYFCDRALSLIAHLDRPLTAAQIEAVRQKEIHRTP